MSMTTLKKVFLRPKMSLDRRQPLLNLQQSKPQPKSRIGEVAGGSTAECAAVACCCPCVLADLVVLVMYRLPAGLYKRALRHRRRQRLAKKGLLPLPLAESQSGEFESGGGSEVDWLSKRRRRSEEETEEGSTVVIGEETEMTQLEKEMWDHFYRGGGFWRSSSLKGPQTEK